MKSTNSEDGKRSVMIDMVISGTDFIISRNGQPLTSPSGQILSSQNARLIQHVSRDMSLGISEGPNPVSGYTLLCLEKDAVGKADDRMDDILPDILSTDPFIAMRSSPARNDKEDIDTVLSMMDDDSPLFGFVFEGMSSVIKTFNTFLMEQSQNIFGITSPPSGEFISFVRKRFNQLSPAAKAGVIALIAAHDAGILLPILLVESRITSSEYTTFLFGAARTLNRASDSRLHALLGIEGIIEDTFPDWQQPRMRFTQIKNQANEVVEYLSYSNSESVRSTSAAELIRMGESFTMEFKTSLRMNIVTSKKDPAIEHASLKTIAAFLNSAGGTLLIGVRDDGSIAGIETDEFENTDRFSLHFWNLVKSSFGHEITPFVTSELETINGKTVCIVRCRQSTTPVFLRQKGFPEEFFIRIGPSSAALGLSETLSYIKEKFKS